MMSNKECQLEGPEPQVAVEMVDGPWYPYEKDRWAAKTGGVQCMQWKEIKDG